MNNHRYGRLTFFVGILIFAVTGFALFSLVQQQASAANPTLDTPARAALEKVRRDAWFNKRTPHPACPNCYKVDDGLEGIFEAVPGTDRVISRDIPDPTPVEPGEVRPTKHPDTGEPLWYKGRQAFVGPTDEEPVSASLPVPLIEVKRIKYRHEAELFKIEGVHAVGIGKDGVLVSILPEKSANRRFIPPSIEGIPVVIQETNIPQLQSHQFKTYSPVPVGAGITSQTPTGGNGTVGPHVSRDLADGIGYCCQLYSLTAGHVIQRTWLPPSNVWQQRVILQGVFQYGRVSFMFQQNNCGSYSNCSSYGTPANDVRIRPDVAAIGHEAGFDYYPMLSPCNGTDKPVRRMQYGVNSWVHGPTGIVRIPNFSTCPGKCLKIWGAKSHGIRSSLYATEQSHILATSQSGIYVIDYPVDDHLPQTATQDGDSGALIAWNSSRDIAGLHIASNQSYPYQGVYQRLDYIRTAFDRAGVSFDHYWGTAATKSRPSASPYDNPC